MLPDRSLILVATARLADADVARLKGLAASGGTIVAWQHPGIAQERFPSPDVAAALSAQGVPAVALRVALGEAAEGDVEDAVIAWMKAFGRAPLSPRGSFRDIFREEKLSLWWWAELWLYHETPLRLHVRDVEALARLVEREKPDRLVLWGPVRDLERSARHLVARVEVYGVPAPLWRSGFRTSGRFLVALLKMWGTALKTCLRRAPKGAGARFLFLTHGSMWRERTNPETGASELYELYFDPIIPTLVREGERVKAVAVGPPVPFKKRSLSSRWKEILEIETAELPYVFIREYFPAALVFFLSAAFFRCWCGWRTFRRLEGVGDALAHRGVRLGRPALDAFRDTFLLQLPWAIRSYHEVRACLRRERPALLVLYAESSGLGRAALAAARDEGVRSFALQHGIMYPRYYSHEHAPDEVGACPLPTRTAVFGDLARDLFVSRGHYPTERIIVTGSPKFDALVAAAQQYDRSAIRRRLEVEDGVPMLVVATRFSAIGRVFSDLVRAVEATSDLVLLVKPHQAERPDPYLAVLREHGATRVKVLTGEENLLELLFASDGLVTVDSLASSEALVLGRPVLVVNLPTNLTPLVERGVALGAGSGQEIEKQLGRLLHDRDLGAELERRRKEYLQEFAFGADGASTDRIVKALRETAEMTE